MGTTILEINIHTNRQTAVQQNYRCLGRAARDQKHWRVSLIPEDRPAQLVSGRHKSLYTAYNVINAKQHSIEYRTIDPVMSSWTRPVTQKQKAGIGYLYITCQRPRVVGLIHLVCCKMPYEILKLINVTLIFCAMQNGS